MSLDPALILAAIATFALIALATYRLMSKSGDDEDAEPRQKTASRGRGDNTGGDSDDSTIAESFPPSSSASSSRTPTTAAVTSFNGKKSIADALAGTYYARIEATTLATAAAAAASFEPDTAAVAPSWEWETWKWDDCDSYRKAIGLGVDKAMEKALLVQRARTVLARAQVFYKQWPAYARLRDSDVLPFTRQRLHLEAFHAISAEQDDLTKEATAISADFGSSIFSVARHFIALEEREEAAKKEAEAARVLAKKKAIASKKKDRESRKRKAAAAERALVNPPPVDRFAHLSPEERRLEMLRLELLSEGNEGIAVPANGLRRRAAKIAAAAGDKSASAAEPELDRFSSDSESSSEYETDSESEDE